MAVTFIFLSVQKKRLSITHSFGSDHSDSSERLTDSPSLAVPVGDKDRSSTPGSSGGEERQFIVKVRAQSSPLAHFLIIILCVEDGANTHRGAGQEQ